jgi:YfiH family protein
MKQFILEKTFPHKHFTTTKAAGNMKNEIVRNAFLSSLKVNPMNLIVANQVHSSNVKIVDVSNKSTFIDDCDGLITTDKEIILGVYTADCVPLLISAENGKLKAAVHIGWKGLLAGVIENTLELLRGKFYTELKKIKVYIGPHIRSCCYDVSRKMENRFNVKLNNNKLDLSKIVYNKLRKFEVTNIFDIRLCTFHIEHLFFSYRRNQSAERIISVIM